MGQWTRISIIIAAVAVVIVVVNAQRIQNAHSINIVDSVNCDLIHQTEPINRIRPRESSIIATWRMLSVFEKEEREKKRQNS